MAFDEYRNWLGGISKETLSDAVLSEHLNEAEAAVIDDGVDATNDYYTRLVKHKLGSLLITYFSTSELSGLGGAGGSLKREKVADVEVEYGGSSTASGSDVLKDLPGGGFEYQYKRLLKHVLNLQGDNLDWVCQ